jgi:hypothetical protein
VGHPAMMEGIEPKARCFYPYLATGKSLAHKRAQGPRHHTRGRIDVTNVPIWSVYSLVIFSITKL